MSWAKAKKFFKDCDVETCDGGFAVLLDGRQIHTPGGGSLILPGQALAIAVSAEWAAQEETIRPDTMPMTGFCCTTLDTVAGNRADIAGQLSKYAQTDLLCYRADEPEDLVAEQQAQWQPLLGWVEDAFGARLRVTTCILPVDQPPEAIQALQKAAEDLDDWQLTVLASVTQATGSLVIGLAVLHGRLDADNAFGASQLDETWQTSMWGEDSEDAKRRAALNAEIQDAARFLNLVRDGEGP